MRPDAVDVAVALAGITGGHPVSARCLNSLVDHARDHGLDHLLVSVNLDPGLLTVPTDRFGMLPWMMHHRRHRQPRAPKVDGMHRDDFERANGPHAARAAFGDADEEAP